MVRSTIRTIVLLLLIWGQTSCIREGLQECEEVYFITIKVVDMLTGEDITASGEVSHAILFVFDADEQYRSEPTRTRSGKEYRYPSLSKIRITTGCPSGETWTGTSVSLNWNLPTPSITQLSPHLEKKTKTSLRHRTTSFSVLRRSVNPRSEMKK